MLERKGGTGGKGGRHGIFLFLAKRVQWIKRGSKRGIICTKSPPTPTSGKYVQNYKKLAKVP